MNQEKLPFKSTLFGFLKKDVIEYIDMLINTNERKMKEKEEYIHILQYKVGSLHKQVVEYKTKDGSLKNDNPNTPQVSYDEEDRQIGKRDEEIARLKKQLSTSGSSKEMPLIEQELIQNKNELLKMIEENEKQKHKLIQLEQELSTALLDKDRLIQKNEDLKRTVKEANIKQENNIRNEQEEKQIENVYNKAEEIKRMIIEDALAESKLLKLQIEKDIILQKSKLAQIQGEVESMRSQFASLYEKYTS